MYGPHGFPSWRLISLEERTETRGGASCDVWKPNFPGFSLLSLPQITTTSWPDSDHGGPFPSCPHLVSQCYLLSYKLTTFNQFLSFFFCPSPFQPLTLGCAHLLSACLVQLSINRSSLFVVNSAMVFTLWGIFHRDFTM